MTNYINILEEKLLDKGYPRMEAFTVMRLLGIMPGILPLPDPMIYQTKEAADRWYKGLYSFHNKIAKDYIIHVDYTRPVWSNYKNWEYHV